MPDKEDNHTIMNGEKYGICKNSCRRIDKIYNCRYRLPTSPCLLNNQETTLLRDTGCTGVVVHKRLIKEGQYTGINKLILMIDGSIKRVPVAKVNLDCAYFTGEVEAMVMDTPVYDVILGNIMGSFIPDTDTSWKSKRRQEMSFQCGHAVLTRGQAKIKEVKPLSVQEVSLDDLTMKQKEFRLEQEQDQTLKSIWDHIHSQESTIKTTNKENVGLKSKMVYCTECFSVRRQEGNHHKLFYHPSVKLNV